MEAVAAGAQYLAGRGAGRAGVSVSVGRHHGIELRDHGDETDVVATAYTLLAWRTGGGVQLLVSPIGAALVSGNDFLGVYPSAQAGVEVVRGGIRIGTLLRVVRIAGPEGSGDYHLSWSPLRLGWALSW